MFRDTTARNRAHQAFGERNYHWLVLFKLAPWIAGGLAVLTLFGPASVARGLSNTVSFVAASNELTAAVLIGFAVLMLIVKARWRRGDYRP